MATASSVKLFLLVYLQDPNSQHQFLQLPFFIRLTGRSFCITASSGREVPLGRVFLDAMVPWRMEARLAETVWVVLLGWLSSCLTVAGDVARALRSSDLSI
ncbi:uncharacterized protein LOC119320087 [Triticum dicoccoides]|uniref:uncharacterized protein LOC119320087 n=1 Tax=Triticum dicoccoides TaxID=85692 RepID=UPI001890C4CC|nr:uncharacterized protein LOC119320087 [Triticum dicoccoides]